MKKFPTKILQKKISNGLV